MRICLMPLVCLLLASVSQAAPAPKPDMPANTDPERFKASPVVLRVKLDSPRGGETGMFWYRVKVLSVLKNDTKQTFGPMLEVATYVKNFGPKNNSVPGVPPEECTLYLEPLRNSKDLWALRGGRAESGVSHVAGKDGDKK